MWKRQTSTFSYEILWRAAQSALKMCEIEDPRIRADDLSMHGILTGFLAFEGFINFVGSEIALQKWKKEKEFFSCEPFRGIIGKVDYLFTLFPATPLNKGKEPYQTFYKIKKIRDHLAHNRVNSYNEITPDQNPSFRTKWDDFNSPEKVLPALQRLKEFAEIIRVEAVKLLKEDYRLSHLHFSAFEGPLGISQGDEIQSA